MKLRYFFFLIFFAGLLLRTFLLPNHFSHTDDLIVPRTMSLNEEVFEDYVSDRIDRLSDEDFYLVDFYFKYNKIILDHFDLAKTIILPLILSKNTTYAPGQYFISSCLNFNISDSYKMMKVKSRIINFIWFVLLFIGLFYLFKNSNNKLSFLIIPIIISFSWTSIIYSVQSSPYFILILSQFFYFYFLANYKSSNKKYLLFTILLLLPLFNYLNIFFSSIVVFFFFFKDVFRLKIRSIFLSLFSLIFFLFVYFFFLKNKTARTLNWNTGENHEFLFSQDSIGEIFYFPFFLIKNGFISLVNHINFTGKFDLISILIVIILIVLSNFGLYKLFFNDKLKKYFYYILLSFLLIVSLIFLGKLTLSPTRHTIYLIPLISILSYVGLNNLTLNRNNLFDKYVLFFYSCICLVWVIYLPFNIKNRSDKFDEKFINKVIVDYKVNNIVLYDWTYQPIYMPSFALDYNFVDNGEKNLIMSRKLQYNTGSTLFISQRNDSIEFNIAKKEFLDNPISLNEVLEIQELSQTEIATLNLTKNGTNNLIMNIYK